MYKPIVNSSEKPLLIAIPTNDGKNIFPKMLGMARYFYIYSLTDDSQFALVEIRPNPYETTMPASLIPYEASKNKKKIIEIGIYC